MAAPVEGGELGQEAGPTPYHPDPALKTHPMLPMQFHSFDRFVCVPLACWELPPPTLLLLYSLFSYSLYFLDADTVF